jgi:hypothetical protein
VAGVQEEPVSAHPIHEVDDDVHQRVRLGILASLVALARADFARLKRELAALRRIMAQVDGAELEAAVEPEVEPVPPGTSRG